METNQTPEEVQAHLRQQLADQIEEMTDTLDATIRKAIANGLQVKLSILDLGYREKLVSEVFEVKRLTHIAYHYRDYRNLLVTDVDSTPGPEGPEEIEPDPFNPWTERIEQRTQLDENSHTMK